MWNRESKVFFRYYAPFKRSRHVCGNCCNRRGVYGLKPAFCSFLGTALPTVFSTSVLNPQLFNDFYARHLA